MRKSILQITKSDLKKNKAIMVSLENKIMELNNKIKETELSKQKALIEMENKNKIFRQKLIGDALSSNIITIIMKICT